MYWLKDGMLADCNCRVGDCSRWHVNKGDTFALTETDGALHVALHANSNATDQIYDGGINRAGDFRVGSSYATGGNISYSLLSGTVKTGVSIAADSRNTYVAATVAVASISSALCGKVRSSKLTPTEILAEIVTEFSRETCCVCAVPNEV